MESREVRIGNLFDNNGNINTVTPSVIEALFESEGRSWIKPIPLTEDWLLKFGFNKWKNKNNWTISSFIIYTLSKQEGFFFGKKSLRTSVKYVHQLQNLYFALTQKELEYGE